MHDIAERPAETPIERPAGGKHQPMSLRIGNDAGAVEADHLACRHLIAESEPVLSRDLDFIAGFELAEEGEVRIAVRRKDRGAALSGTGRPVEMARTEGHRLAAAALKCYRRQAEPRHADLRDGPGIGP